MGLRPIFLAAGGTGGHLFPAEALAIELKARGASVELVTDIRAKAYAGNFPARAVHAVSSDTVRGRSAIALLRTATSLGVGFGESVRLLRDHRPIAVVGFGGYPSVPPIAAAQLLRIPTIIHEQNAVMGRGNRLLAKRATAIATGFASLSNAEPAIRAKAVHVGNPVRPAVRQAAETPFLAPEDDGPIHILVFGGSQGARIMAQVVPPALALLDGAMRARLRVTQQARKEDIEAVMSTYAVAGISADIAPFFSDLPQRMAQAHLVIGRSGASTVAELGVIGRPSILVPLPHSLDQDQLHNARMLGGLGAATIILQDDFTPEALAAHLRDLFNDPDRLAMEAAAAHNAGLPDAASRLADLVLKVARGSHT